MAPKSGALIVSGGSTGRFKNKLFPTVAITDRDIQAFSKHVLGTMDPLLKNEYRGLASNEKEAAIEAVAAAFTNSSSDVFVFDFDPETYARHIKETSASRVSKVHLSESGAELYSRLISEVAAQTLNFITTWPSFLARANVEQLKRMTRIAKDLEQIRKSVIDNASQEDISFEERYAEVVVEKLDQLELFGVTVSDNTQRTYPLSTAYISLSVTEGTSRRKPSDSDDRLKEVLAADSRSLEEAVGGLRSESAIANFDRILLRGDAGSGKTTLLCWLAVNAVRRSFDGELGNFNGYLPFIIPLRRFADRSLPAAHEFLSETGRHLAGEMPSSWVNRALRSGRAFVLIDGVDELPETRREEAKEWIAELLSSYPSVRYIVTSRPGAAEEEWLSREKFTSVDMLPMSSTDIRNFIQHWHASARACLPDNADERQLEELDDFEEELLSAIRQQAQLRKLSSNPLLCALLCTLSRDRRMQLPQGRMELYAAALEMLLVRRDAERRIKHLDTPNMTLLQKQRILGVFAYWLLRNKLTDSTEQQAVSQIDIALKSMPAVTASGKEVYKYLMVRSGLLRQPIEGRVDFIHRTFQEYLAADTLVSLNDIGALVQNAHLDQWHEVVTMAVGHARPQERSEILTKLLDRGDEEGENRTRLHLLAGACLENADQLDEGTFQLVRGKVSALIPPSRVTDAKELAAVGPAALPLLPRSVRGLLAGQAAASVRTASLVGGEVALDILSGYASDTRRMVFKELSRAWRQFDVEEYADRVMSKSPLAQDSLVIDNPELLAGVKYFRRLSSLECRALIPNLDWVDDAPPLVSLTIGHTAADADLSPLVKIPSLTHLAFAQGPIKRGALSWLKQLPKLTDLRLMAGDRLEIGSPFIPPLPDLQHLTIGAARDAEMSKISEALPSLQRLEILLCDKVDLSGIERLTNLRNLRLFDCPEIINCEAINELGDLKDVMMLNAHASSAAELAKIRNVRDYVVYFRTRKGDELDLTPFVDHPTVRIHIPGSVKFFPSIEVMGHRVIVSPRYHRA
ncbi:NACHT domain-containing protein [Streptomyces sp. NPDC056463]|uniref:NACHT domain-containing protein n=1 Tax=Streptomyces sp. NPDC056463 TaxID=3345827 RepID=UPI0036850105